MIQAVRRMRGALDGGQLLNENRGKIDVKSAEAFLVGSSRYFSRDGCRRRANALWTRRGIAARQFLSGNGTPHYPGGVVQGKAMDSRMAQSLTFVARIGHPCGSDFIAAPFLQGASGISVAVADPSRHESWPVDGIPCWRKGGAVNLKRWLVDWKRLARSANYCLSLEFSTTHSNTCAEPAATGIAIISGTS